MTRDEIMDELDRYLRSLVKQDAEPPMGTHTIIPFPEILNKIKYDILIPRIQNSLKNYELYSLEFKNKNIDKILIRYNHEKKTIEKTIKRLEEELNELKELVAKNS